MTHRTYFFHYWLVWHSTNHSFTGQSTRKHPSKSADSLLFLIIYRKFIDQKLVQLNDVQSIRFFFFGNWKHYERIFKWFHIVCAFFPLSMILLFNGSPPEGAGDDECIKGVRVVVPWAERIKQLCQHVWVDLVFNVETQEYTQEFSQSVRLMIFYKGSKSNNVWTDRRMKQNSWNTCEEPQSWADQQKHYLQSLSAPFENMFDFTITVHRRFTQCARTCACACACVHRLLFQKSPLIPDVWISPVCLNGNPVNHQQQRHLMNKI